MNTYWPVWRLLSLPLYSPHYSRDRINILHSHCPEWEHELCWLWRLRLFPFSRILLNFELFNTHWLMFKSGFVIALQLTLFRVSCSYQSQLLALLRARILLITVSLMKISSWAIMHFSWSWSNHTTLNLHFRYRYLSWKPYTNSLVFEHFWWQYLSF